MNGGLRDCKTCWKVAPKFTLYFILVTAIISLGMIIACLALSGRFNCYLFNYLSMTPYYIFQKGQVWRLLTCYFVNDSFWAIAWIVMGFFFVSVQFEAQKGTGWYILLLLVCCIINSLISTIFMAFFGLIPKINEVGYFRDQWFDFAPIGQTPLLLMTSIFDVRYNKKKTVYCCCFNMPVWLYILLLYIGCQLMMYPPWYGIFYNISAIIIGFTCPLKLLEPSKKQLNKYQQFVNQNLVGQEVNVQGNPQQTEMKFTTMNDHVVEDAQKKNPEDKQTKNNAAWGGNGKKL